MKCQHFKIVIEKEVLNFGLLLEKTQIIGK